MSRRLSEERLREVVSALLNASGRTEAEANVAREKAAKLLSDHGMTESELLEERPDLGVTDVQMGRVDWLVAKFCAMPIARLFECKAYVSDAPTKPGRRTDRKVFHYVGYGPDREAAAWLMSHLLEVSRRSASAAGMRGDRAVSDFSAAFGGRVAARIRELSDWMDRPEVADGRNALVVAKDAVVQEYMDGLGLSLVDRDGRGRSVYADAARAGQRAGDLASLGRPVSSNGPLMIGRG